MNGRGTRYAQGTASPGRDWMVTAYDAATRITHQAERLSPFEAKLLAKLWADKPMTARVWARKEGTS